MGLQLVNNLLYYKIKFGGSRTHRRSSPNLRPVIRFMQEVPREMLLINKLDVQTVRHVENGNVLAREV